MFFLKFFGCPPPPWPQNFEDYRWTRIDTRVLSTTDRYRENSWELPWDRKTKGLLYRCTCGIPRHTRVSRESVILVPFVLLFTFFFKMKTTILLHIFLFEIKILNHLRECWQGGFLSYFCCNNPISLLQRRCGFHAIKERRNVESLLAQCCAPWFIEVEV
jgi:hypothetical protein